MLDALGEGESDAGELTIGATTPGGRRGRRPRAAALARRVLASPDDRSPSAHVPILLSPEQVAPTLSTEIVESKLVLKSDPLLLRATMAPGLALTRDAAQGRRLRDQRHRGVRRPRGHRQARRPRGGRQGDRRRASTRSRAMTEDVQPARTTEWAQKLNITELVSSYTTNYPCCQPRVQNIHRGADVINGTIVAPGRHVLAQHRARPPHPREGLRPRAADRRRPLVRGLGRRRGEPALDARCTTRRSSVATRT